MELTPGQMFIEMSKYDQMGPTEEKQGLPQPALTLPYTGSGPVLDLIPPAELTFGSAALSAMINLRQTLRKYTSDPLSLAELSYLLWVTQGVKEVTARPVTMRTVPSAGARHAFETYLLINNVTGVEPGLYQYLAIEHKLGGLAVNSEMREKVTEACLKQAQVANSAVTFIWVAVVDRMRWRYGQRGYRYMYLDAGHICQNLALGAESIHCGICPIAAYNDDALNAVLKLDGKNLFAIYLASLGRRGS